MVASQFSANVTQDNSEEICGATRKFEAKYAAEAGRSCKKVVDLGKSLRGKPAFAASVFTDLIVVWFFVEC